jgi:hypothetical protein
MDRTILRQRLVEMRDRLVADLGCQVHGGTLTLLADLQGALAALDALPGSDEVESADRVVIADDGEIRLLLYDADRAVGVTLSAARAIRIAGELIEAAGRRLG